MAVDPWLRDEPRFHDMLPLSKSLPVARLLFWNLLVPLLQLWPPRLSPSFHTGVVPGVSQMRAWPLLGLPGVS